MKPVLDLLSPARVGWQGRTLRLWYGNFLNRWSLWNLLHCTYRVHLLAKQFSMHLPDDVGRVEMRSGLHVMLRPALSACRQMVAENLQENTYEYLSHLFCAISKNGNGTMLFKIT